MLTIGKTIYLETMSENTGNKSEYRAKVVEIKENSFFIELPVSKKSGKTGMFTNGMRFTSFITIKNNAIYRFPTQLIGRKVENIPMLELTKPTKEQYVRIQRRSYVRVNFITTVDIHVINSDSLLQAYMLNISAGGLAISLPNNKFGNINDIIWCRFTLPYKSKEIVFNELCQIVRLINDEKNKQIKVYMQFQDIEEADREKVIQFCFQKQLEISRRN